MKYLLQRRYRTAPLASIVLATVATLASPTHRAALASPVPAASQGSDASEAQRTVTITRDGRKAKPATDNVVIISIDGLRPDAIARFKAKTMQRLIRDGSATLSAKTISPSITLPSHTSMLTGQGPENHGITWNSNQTEAQSTVAIPTVFGLARKQGLTTAAFFSKGKFNHLEVPASLDYTQAPPGDDKWSASRTASDVERYLAIAQPNLLFVHFGEPDYSGHVWGWMSWAYGRAVRKADAAVARVLQAADRSYGVGNYTVLLTADHGGHGRSHGSVRPENVTIPWIAWGNSVRTGVNISGSVVTMDTAGTALWLLGVGAPDDWAGVPVREAFLGWTNRRAMKPRVDERPVSALNTAVGG